MVFLNHRLLSHVKLSRNLYLLDLEPGTGNLVKDDKPIAELAVQFSTHITNCKRQPSTRTADVFAERNHR
jgi:hypothetical protein